MQWYSTNLLDFQNSEIFIAVIYNKPTSPFTIHITYKAKSILIKKESTVYYNCI